MGNKIKYSIIIPHKDSFHLLTRLLESIPNVDYIQVIIIDDFSTKETREQLNDFTFNQNTIVLYNNKSAGAGKARNMGLQHAEGKWILFADADDYFSKDAEKLLNSNFSASHDIIYFGTSSIFNDTGELAYRHTRYNDLVENFEPNSKKEDSLRYYFTPPWAKMIRRELIISNNICFDEIVASNDVLFSIKTAYYAKSIDARKEVLYIITVTEGSLTNSLSKKHFDARFNTALRANKFLCSIKKKRYQQSVLYFLAKSHYFGFRYFTKVVSKIIKNRSNLFIGLEKILTLQSVLQQRENNKYLKIKRN